MNENINLCEILRDCPKGTKFYSLIFGEETYFKGVSLYQGEARPVLIYGKYGEGQNFCLSRKGHPYADNYGECCIFPSKEMRDWSKFTAPWLKKERFDPKTLKVFDRALVRFDCGAWSATLFSHLIDSKFANKKYDIICCGSVFGYCIPYNDDTKHLIGTKDEAPEFYKYWED